MKPSIARHLIFLLLRRTHHGSLELVEGEQTHRFGTAGEGYAVSDTQTHQIYALKHVVRDNDKAERFIAQARRYEVELLSAVSVEHISAEDSEGGDICIRLASGQEIETHAALIATGSSYRRLGVPGEDDLIGAGVHFCATCDGPFYRGADELLVIGGGN